MSEQSKTRYQEYLKSAHWTGFKKLKAERTSRMCSACSSRQTVQLHHMIYRDPIELAQLEDTCWLCRDCHETFHQRAGTQLKGVTYAQLLTETVRVIIDGCEVVVRDPKIQKPSNLPKVKFHVVPGSSSNNLGSWKTITYAEQEKRKTRKGGFSRSQMSAWGVNWPAKKGWRQRLNQGRNPNK